MKNNKNYYNSKNNNARAREGEVNLDDESYDDFKEHFSPVSQMCSQRARERLEKVRSEVRQKHAAALKAAMEERSTYEKSIYD